LKSNKLKNQSFHISLTYEDINYGTSAHCCYISRVENVAERKANIPIPKNTFNGKIEDVSFLTPAVIGVTIMIVCFTCLACVTFTAWGMRMRNDNEKMTMQLKYLKSNTFSHTITDAT